MQHFIIRKSFIYPTKNFFFQIADPVEEDKVDSKPVSSEEVAENEVFKNPESSEPSSISAVASTVIEVESNPPEEDKKEDIAVNEDTKSNYGDENKAGKLDFIII